MADVFGRVDAEFGGGLSADALQMVFPGVSGAGLLIQNFTLQYTQPIRRIYDLSNSRKVYYVIGRPEGNWQMARIFGFADFMAEFYRTYGNPCNDNTVVLQAAHGCLPGQASPSAFIIMSGFIVSMIGLSASAQEMLVQENCGGIFTNLRIEGSSSAQTTVAQSAAAAATAATEAELAQAEQFGL